MDSNPASYLPPTERLRIVSLNEAAKLAGCSAENLRRHYGDKIIQISPRRCGMRVGDALLLNSK
jgi:hypothetical protein